MKCPHCGHWNRASFPRCFRCGTPLTPDPAQPQTSVPAQEPPAAPSKVYIQINEEGRSTSSIDERDKLAQEMKDLVVRKEKGEVEQRRLRAHSVQQGLAPSGRTVQTLTGRHPFPPPQSTSYYTEEGEVGGDVRPDAIPVVSQRTIDYDEYDDPRQNTHTTRLNLRHMKSTRRFGLRRFTRYLAYLLIVACLGFSGYQFVIKPLILDRKQPPLQERVIITPSILDDAAAHTIKLPGTDGQSIWIKELRKSYLVEGGYATIEVADHEWYEALTNPILDAETITATLTPYLKTSAGEQKPMEQVTFEVEVPLSPLRLISPSASYIEVSTALYNVQFEVAANSSVSINGEDYSDLVNTQDGLISYNASVAPIGANTITITTRAQHYRENSMTLTIYRQPQQIRLDLAADIASRYSPNLVDDTTKPKDAKGKYPQIEEPMTIRGTTVSWATIRILSPYANLDTTQLALNGSFSFQPVFEKIGTNTIIIEASAPGYETSVVKHDIYYVPISAVYTRKAWDMDQNYTDYLNNADRRIANTQIYVCKGTVTQVLSVNPQLALVQLDSNNDRSVLVENLSNDTWEVGKKYRIFADAYGVYNGMPRLVGRYTYLPN